MAHNLKQALNILTMASKLVGQTSNVYFDSSIYSHSFMDDDPDFSPELDLFVLKATEKHPVTMHGIIDTFNKMQAQFEALDEADDDRSYFYEGIEFDKKNNVWCIRWGS